MVRKAPNARERFEEAALALFRERGYARTTVPEIAARAELTERTFYRYFADKPEVLFWRADELHASIAQAIGRAPASAAPLDAVVGAFEVAGTFFDARRADVMVRQALVAAHPEFREREVMKSRSLASGIDAALRRRGVHAPAARMAAEAAVAIWRAAMDGWRSDEASQAFSHHVRSSAAALRAVVTGDAAVSPHQEAGQDPGAWHSADRPSPSQRR